ncbi:leucine-rich alpha-2-glycoprotein [Ascaphus truei]|uniref:leucine-rich alpha-2-glycoprotein n=1 Tax=Ascaphus truei TaxID=8439 RepID=UPI003F598327
MSLSWVSILLALWGSLPCVLGSVAPCPSLCNCTSSPNISVVCTSPELSSFPSPLPLSTITISVEFTNISALCPDALSGLSLLEELHLSNNALRSLPSRLFTPLGRLHTLDLTNNLLQTLPPRLFRDTPSMRSLVLSGNLLTELWPPVTTVLEGLVWLDVSRNRLSALHPDSFSSLRSLQSLDLSYNQLRELPPLLLRGPHRLQRLHLEGNALSSLPPTLFAHSPHLQYLFLSHNSLRSLPAGLLRPLPLLHTLDVSENALRTLPAGLLEEAPGLGGSVEQALDLSGNPWQCDCHLLSLHSWVTQHRAVLYSTGSTRCAGPVALRNVTLVQLQEEDLRRSCPETPGDEPEWKTTIQKKPYMKTPIVT